MKNITDKIDDLIVQIKKKVETGGQGAADFFIIMTLEIAGAEIKNKNLTDLTIGALMEIASRTSHFYYYHDYRDLYDCLQDVYLSISKLDKKFYDADFSGSVNFKPSSWINYLNKASSALLTNLPTSYRIDSE